MDYETYWNGLSKEEKQLSFLAVTKLIRDHVIYNETSYNKFVKDVLEFENNKHVDLCYDEVHEYILLTVERIQDRII